jgi:hypothetical protein
MAAAETSCTTVSWSSADDAAVAAAAAVLPMSLPPLAILEVCSAGGAGSYMLQMMDKRRPLRGRARIRMPRTYQCLYISTRIVDQH